MEHAIKVSQLRVKIDKKAEDLKISEDELSQADASIRSRIGLRYSTNQKSLDGISECNRRQLEKLD